MRLFIDVSLPTPKFNTLKYSISDEDISIGDYVLVSLRNNSLIGVVITKPHEYNTENCKYEIKQIIKKLDLPKLNSKFIDFINYCSMYYMTTSGFFFKMIINNNLGKDILIKPTKNPQPKDIPVLSDEQKHIKDCIIKKIDKFSVHLIDGETGSGKTEIYCSVIFELLKHDPSSQILVIVPEIGLISQLIKKIRSYFHQYTVVELHSGISQPKRKAQNINLILSGTASVIIGARSALFKPYKNLKLIIIDEEHDDSFKNEQILDCNIRTHDINYISNTYNSRDMAVLLSKNLDIPIILSSATPSLETFYNALIGKYDHYVIASRFGESQIPNIIIEDIQNLKHGDILSDSSKSLISETLNKKKQILIFLNQKGYAPVTFCNACKKKVGCPKCSGTLKFRKSSNTLSCNYCTYSVKFENKCPNCHELKSMIHYGIGIEKIEETVKQLFPKTRVAVLSTDTSNRNAKSVIESMLEGSIDILIGTQVIAKGHNFEKLSLVVIVDAESSVVDHDLRSHEKMYQLLHQVSGRSGRYKEQGTVIIQTTSAEHPVINAVKNFNKNLFYEIELESRKKNDMPPFSRLRAVILGNKNKAECEKDSMLIAKKLSNISGITVLGPIPAPIEKINDMYRYRILIKTKKPLLAQIEIKKVLEHIKSVKNITVDIDPRSFL